MSNKILVGIIFGILFIGLNCSKNNPVKPHPEHPEHPPHPDTITIHDTTIVRDTTIIKVPIIFEIVDLKVEGDVIIDRSVPNIYAAKRNGIEEKRFTLTETSEIPRTVIISYTFKDYKILEDTFSIEIISGSRAAVKGVRVVEIIFKE